MQAFDDQGFMVAKDAAAFLGVPLRSLHQYVQQGLLPSYKLGRHRLFRRLELLNALRRTTKATRDEILRQTRSNELVFQIGMSSKCVHLLDINNGQMSVRDDFSCLY